MSILLLLSIISFLSLLFVWFLSFSGNLFDSLLLLSPYIFPFLFCVCFSMFILFYFIFIFVLDLCASLSFLCLSVYRGSWRMYVVPGIAQHNGMTL